MKPSILIVMLDFLVCSLLMFVIGTGGQKTQFATSSPPSSVHEAFSAAALQAQQEEWNRDYEQQTMLTRLNAETAENEQLRTRLTSTSATLAQREANLKQLTAEKEQVEQAKAQTEKSLSNVETQLGRVSAERARLEQEGRATKQNLAKVQTELTGLQAQQTKLQQERAQLEQHAQQLGQTVASQQATISALSDEVRASQARTEAQLTDIAQGQQQMGATLGQLNELTRTLPAAIQKNAAGVAEQQQAMQQNVAALAEDVKQLQNNLSPEDRAKLLQAMSDMAKGQQAIQSRLDGLVKGGQGNDQFGQSLNNIAAGQEELRKQTAKLGEQIESIKARGPGPFQSIKEARAELAVAITAYDATDRSTVHFKLTIYPPVVRVDQRSLIVANAQALGFNWWPLSSGYVHQNTLTDMNYSLSHSSESAPVPLTSPACALRADPHLIALEVSEAPSGLTAMELAPPQAILQTDQHKLYVFKSTAAGLSFEVDTSPDLSDARYLTVKHSLRGLATLFENPAYRPDVGDYMVTDDGKLVGIMLSRERCFVFTKENLTNCALSIPLADRQQFQRTIPQLAKLR